MSNIIQFDPLADQEAIGHSLAIDAIIAKYEWQALDIGGVVDTLLECASDPDRHARALLTGFVTELLDMVPAKEDAA